jgi:hypothetical protein
VPLLQAQEQVQVQELVLCVQRRLQGLAVLLLLLDRKAHTGAAKVAGVCVCVRARV